MNWSCTEPFTYDSNISTCNIDGRQDTPKKQRNKPHHSERTKLKKKWFSKSSYSNKCKSWETCGLCDSPHHVSEPAPQARCSTGLLCVCSMCAHCSTGLNTTSTKHLHNRLALSFFIDFFSLPKLRWKSTGLWQELVHLGLHKVSSELRGDRFLSKVILAVV